MKIKYHDWERRLWHPALQFCVYFNEEDVLITRISSTFHLAEQRVSSSSWAGPGSGAVVTTEGGWTRQRGKWTAWQTRLFLPLTGYQQLNFYTSHWVQRIPGTRARQPLTLLCWFIRQCLDINRWCCQFPCYNHLSHVSVSCLTAATLRLSAWTKITSFKLLAAACRRDTWIISICSEPCSGYRGVSGAVTCNV